MNKYVPGILSVLYGSLKNSEVDKRVKASILCLLGDMCMHCENVMSGHIMEVIELLKNGGSRAVEIQTDYEDEETKEYKESLRYNVLDGLSGVLYSLKILNKAALFAPYVIQFIFIIKQSVLLTTS